MKKIKNKHFNFLKELYKVYGKEYKNIHPEKIIKKYKLPDYTLTVLKESNIIKRMFSKPLEYFHMKVKPEKSTTFLFKEGLQIHKQGFSHTTCKIYLFLLELYASEQIKSQEFYSKQFNLGKQYINFTFQNYICENLKTFEKRYNGQIPNYKLAEKIRTTTNQVRKKES